MRRKIISTVWVILWLFIYFYMQDYDLSGMGYVIAGTALWAAAVFLLPRIRFEWLRRLNDRVWDGLDSFLGERVLFFQVWFLGILIFLPAFVAYFPGIFGYDSARQFAMYMGDVELDAANPLMHTLLLGSVTYLGKLIFGSYQAGFACFVALQGLLFTNCMAQAFLFLKRRKVFLPVIVIGLIWVAANPYIQILTCNSTKDTLCGILFMDFVMALSNVLEQEKSSKFDIFWLVFTGIFTCLLRNPMIWMMLVIVLAALCLRMKKKGLYLAMAAIVVFAGCFSFLSSHVFHILKAPIKENLSVPIQQLAYTLVLYDRNPESVVLTEEQKEAILRLMPSEEGLLNTFMTSTADGPKGWFDEETFRSDVSGYLKLYWEVWRQNPETFRLAWVYLIQPYFNMNGNEFKGLMTGTFWEQMVGENRYDIHNDAQFLLHYREYLDVKAMGNTARIHDPSIAILILGLLIGKLVAKGQKERMLGIFPALFYLVGILFGPVALMRYTYPLMLLMPLLLGLFFAPGKEDIIQGEDGHAGISPQL